MKMYFLNFFRVGLSPIAILEYFEYVMIWVENTWNMLWYESPIYLKTLEIVLADNPLYAQKILF